MSAQSRSEASSAAWVTIVVLIGVLIAIYFVWPQAVAYNTNLNIRTIVKANAKSCIPITGGDPDKCRLTMINQIKAKTGVQILTQHINIHVVGRKKVKVGVKYKSKMIYPFTGTLLGSDKDRFKSYKWTMDVESKYVM